MKKILEALDNSNSDSQEDSLVSLIDSQLTIGQLRELLISAILKGRCISEGSDLLEDWQIADTKIWYFPEWVQQQKIKYEKQ